jgi:hypothetical protein
MTVEARFVSAADAEHAEYDTTVAERQIAVARDSSEFVRQVLALIGNVEIVRHGEDLRVSVHATRAFSQYVLGTLGHERSGSRRRPAASSAIAP